TPEYYRNRGMVVTNNSYGAGSGCYPVAGEYSIYCAELDRLTLDYPEVIHVFAAGNAGGSTCTPFPTGYKTIDNAYQAAKNVLTVGGSNDEELNIFSKGPAMDGRLKPEITAIGVGSTSTAPNNGYQTFDGTSAAAPQVAGCLALMYQHYRQLNAGRNPPADLMKAVVCNTATDIGRKGIDFESGFGWVNPADAIDLLTKKFYFTDSVEHGETKQFRVNIDQPVHTLRFLLYWADKPASLYSKINIVNDLDISVTYPDGSVHLPLVLDTSAAGVLLLAREGEDHLNNIEQVQTDAGKAGLYTITVRGNAVPFGPQAFQLVYYYQRPGLKLLQPAGGETWKSGDTRRVLWQNPTRPEAPVQLAFSADNGATWTDLGMAHDRLGKATISLPAVASTQTLLRLSEAATGEAAVSARFAVLPEIHFRLENICADTICIRFTKPPGVDSVLLYQFDTGYLVPRGYYADTVIYITGSRPPLPQWFSLAPVKDGIPGERSEAQSIIPVSFACAGQTNGDMALRALLLPAPARQGSTVMPLNKIKYIIENKGNTIFSDSLYVYVSVDGLPPVREPLFISLPPLGVDTLEAVTGIPATPTGDHPVCLSVSAAGDLNPLNDTLRGVWTYLPNPPLTLPYEEDFSTLPLAAYGSPGRFGLAGAPAWDFHTASASLKLQTGDSAGLSSMSRIRYQSYELTATYNLSYYRLTDNIHLNLVLSSADQTQLLLQVRGRDNLPWITLPVEYVQRFNGRNLNIGYFLAHNGQTFSASTQLRLQFTDKSFREKLPLLSSLSWYGIAQDVSVESFSTPAASCLSGDSLPVRVVVQNQSLLTQNQVPVSFWHQGVELARIEIDSIPALATADTSLRLPATGFHTGLQPIYAVAQLAGDAIPANDSAGLDIMSYAVVSTFPYFQSFEQGPADWYNTRLYQLSDSVAPALPVFAAANGKSYWRPQPVFRGEEGYDAVFNGYLYSPAFNTRVLAKPMLSMSVNKQLCDGLDSVLIEVSHDQGLTWLRLDATQNATHLYEQGSAFMAVCDSADWQVLSLPLPEWEQLTLVRIASSKRENSYATVLPKLSAGLLADDIHVYDGSAPLVTPPVRAWKSPTYNGHIVLPWLWTRLPGDTAARARFFFTHEEWRRWPGRKTCGDCAVQGNPYALSVFRYSGPLSTIDSMESNNLPGYETEIKAADFDLVPYKDGYFAEISQPVAGEYYIGLAGSLTGFQFEAHKQAGVDAAILTWSLPSNEGIRGYAVERSVNSDGVDGPYEQIDYRLPGAATAFSYNDNRISLPATCHYRIRIDYENGSYLYSYVETVGFEGKPAAALYPNPWQSGELYLYFENRDGGQVDLQLLDLQGRRLWRRTVQRLPAQQRLPVAAAVKGRPAGIYFLKMNAGGQKAVFRLVVSGK
ncbi:MAG: S8 family serine peptidase, partial [Flavihumibacter sp.]